MLLRSGVSNGRVVSDRMDILTTTTTSRGGGVPTVSETVDGGNATGGPAHALQLAAPGR